MKVLKGTFKAGRFAAIPRKVLVVVQFTVSVTLIIGTIIVYRQIQFAKDRPVGYTREGLVSIPTADSSIHQHFNAVKDELIKQELLLLLQSREHLQRRYGVAVVVLAGKERILIFRSISERQESRMTMVKPLAGISRKEGISQRIFLPIVLRLS